MKTSKEYNVDERTTLIDKSLADDKNRGRYEFAGVYEEGLCAMHMPIVLSKLLGYKRRFSKFWREKSR